MAVLVKPDGSYGIVSPKKGEKFTLEELQEFVGGYIEITPSKIEGTVLVVNEEGLLNNLPYNHKSSLLSQAGYIVGPAIHLTEDELD